MSTFVVNQAIKAVFKDMDSRSSEDINKEIDDILMLNLICKCCGKQARWCGDGLPGSKAEDDIDELGPHSCDHIHCDHCGMHYSLESKESMDAETLEEARRIMYKVYNRIDNE